MLKTSWRVGLLALVLSLSVGAQAAGVRRIVVFDSTVPHDDQQKIAQASGGKLVRELPLINAMVIEMPEAALEASDTLLKNRPEVVRVDSDPVIKWFKSEPIESFAEVPFPDIAIEIPRFQATESHPIIGPQDAPWGVKRVNAPAAWNVTKGAGVKVCIVDTGIDRTHPDLVDNIAGGWNATNKTDDFNDDNGHGSHVSGTIAGTGKVNGVVGVAPKASLYGVKALDSQGSGTFDDVIAGMQWCVDHKMDVMSMSLGADQGNDSLKAAVDAIAKSDTVLIAAAGNSGPGENTIGYPANYDGAIAVAASGQNPDLSDYVADFSSRGDKVAVIAPGANVYSTYMQGGFATLDGTSMATPHVSGLAALAIAAKHIHGVAAVRAALTAAATPLAGNPPATQEGAGMIDAFKLVQ